MTVSRHPAPTGRPTLRDIRCQWAKSVGSRLRASLSQAHARSGLRRSRLNLLRSRIPSAQAIEAAIDLDDPEIVQRLAAVYDRAEELLQERLAKRSRSRRRSAGDDDSAT